MKSIKQRYEEAVERNLFNAERRTKEGKFSDKPYTRTRLGIGKEDDRFDSRITNINRVNYGNKKDKSNS